MTLPERIKAEFANIAKPVVAFAALILLWQAAVGPLGIPAYVLPLPFDIAVRFWDTFQVQLSNLGFTAASTVIGLALAVAIGVLLALVVIFVDGLRSTVIPMLAAMNSIPKVAIAPLFIIWFGFGIESKIFLAFLFALFPIFISALTGMGEIDADILDLSKLAGGSPWKIFIKVRLMNAVPYLVDALKVAFPLALVGAIVGEFIGGNKGVGYLILSGQGNLDTTLVFSALVSITVFTMAGIGVVIIFERIFLRWRHSQRKR